jgi:protein-S-isoprenylcysteine O-methyltransferase Ste14
MFSPMSENRNLPVLLSILGLFLVAVGVGLACFSVAVPDQPTVQPFVVLGVVLASLGLVLLIVAFAKMRPTRPVRWRTKKPEIEL